MSENENQAGLSAMGSTFAERAASRVKAEKPLVKSVDNDDAAVEDKAVGRASTKAGKSAARKGA